LLDDGFFIPPTRSANKSGYFDRSNTLSPVQAAYFALGSLLSYPCGWRFDPDNHDMTIGEPRNFMHEADADIKRTVMYQYQVEIMGKAMFSVG
jgi:hypothetical protein